MKEIATKISYHHGQRSEKSIKSGSRKYCVLKWENTQYKVENGIQSNKIFFVGLLKILAVKSSGFRAFRDTAEKEELINVMLTMH